MYNHPLLFLVFMTLGSHFIHAQTSYDTTAVIKQLDIIRDRDQKTRMGRDSIEYMRYLDSCNLVQIESLISQYGWLDKRLVGARGNQTCFLVIQHADSASQVKYLPILQQSVERGESSEGDYAMLLDRVLMRQGKPQLYGSQVVPDKENGGWKFYTIKDEEHVNMRRARLKWIPMEEYAKLFGIIYKKSNE